MRVKIGNQWHDSINEPICIQVGRGEQKQIAEMDRSVATHGRYAVFPDSWGGNPVAMRQWIQEEEEEADPIHKKLDEARALLAQALDLQPTELEPPILKEQGDLENARKMNREMLEEKYVLARMAARLAERRCRDLEAETGRLRHANEFRKDLLRIEESRGDRAERDCDDATALIEKITGKPFNLREALEAGEEARRQAEGAT